MIDWRHLVDEKAAALADSLPPRPGRIVDLDHGARVVFRRPVDRYPFFKVDQGATGTVDHSWFDVDALFSFAVLLDEPPPGAAEWLGRVEWINQDTDAAGLRAWLDEIDADLAPA